MQTQRQKLDLSGTWDVYLDSDDEGLHAKWYDREPDVRSGEITLPGCLEEHGFGERPNLNTEWIGSQRDTSFYDRPEYAPFRDAGTFRFPYWLQPERRYTGPAWYRRTVAIPESWADKRVVLRLERPHWGTHVWIDGHALGSNDSLSVPHMYELGAYGEPGTHEVWIRVDNRMLYDVGQNAHSVSDHTQGNWHGVVGRIELEATGAVYVHHVDVYPNPRRRTVLLRVEIGNISGEERGVTVAVSGDAVRRSDRDERSSVPVGGSVVHREVLLEDSVGLWNEHTPSLVDLDVVLRDVRSDGSVYDSRSLRIGLRAVGRRGSRITVNDEEVSLRGTLECAVFPKTGYPPTDQDSWREILQRAQAFGLNHLRFHSWCPPEAAFDAADEAGIYLQVECPVWANMGASVGTGGGLDQWLFRESERIVSAYGNHPSFVMFSSGNEPAGRTEEFLGLWVSYWKARDTRRLYTSAAGWPAIEENDYHNVPAPRIHQSGDGLNSRINGRAPETETDYQDICASYSAPVVSHEIGQWCVFPNFDEIPKYTGYLKAKNFEIFREFLARNGMSDQQKSFLHASGRLQLLCYREEIESALRTRNQSGFHLLGLTDFPGQGTALVGVLDAFWEEKGYCSAAEFREFCGPTVVLARLNRRVFRVGEHVRIPVEISHYGAAEVKNQRIEWRIESESGEEVTSGTLADHVEIGRGLSHVGTVETQLVVPRVPGRYELQVTIPDMDIRNRWSIWCFPQRGAGSVDTDVSDVHVVTTMDEETERLLAAGGSVLLLPDSADVLSDVEIGFSPVFWNTAWMRGHAPHTLGLVCDPDHPALAEFPTDYHADWQWWELVHGAAAMVLDALPQSLRPIVQPIDTWFRSHRLSLLFEARIGPGKIVVAGMDLRTALDERIVARQMRASITHYMNSDRFQPAESLTVGQLRSLFREAL